VDRCMLGVDVGRGELFVDLRRTPSVGETRKQS